MSPGQLSNSRGSTLTRPQAAHASRRPQHASSCCGPCSQCKVQICAPSKPARYTVMQAAHHWCHARGARACWKLRHVQQTLRCAMAAASLLLSQRHTSHLNAHRRSFPVAPPAGIGAGALLCRLPTRVQDAADADLGATSAAAGCWAFLCGGSRSGGDCCRRGCCCCCGLALSAGVGWQLPAASTAWAGLWPTAIHANGSSSLLASEAAGLAGR